jgi:UDPglucose 6-dehydrogenase
LKWVEVCARRIGAIAKGHTIVVEKSTLPVRTAEIIKEILEAKTKSAKKMVRKKHFQFFQIQSFLLRVLL